MSSNSNFNLPWGWDAYVGDGYHSEETKKLESDVKCECGTTITLGAEDSPELHQSYCPVYKQFKEKETK